MLFSTKWATFKNKPNLMTQVWPFLHVDQSQNSYPLINSLPPLPRANDTSRKSHAHESMSSFFLNFNSSYIALNYIHIKFWVVCDAMVLGMKNNLLIWLLICSYIRLRNSLQVGPNCLWCLQIAIFCFFFVLHKCMKVVGPS